MGEKAYGDMTDTEKRQSYRKSVRLNAKEALKAKEEYDQPLSEAIWEGVDGSQWIIYTARNLDVLRLADSEPSARHLWKEADDWRDAIQGMAFDVMRRDVRERVEELKDKKDKEKLDKEV